MSAPGTASQLHVRKDQFYPAEGNQVPVLIELMHLTEAQFEERFRNSPVRRAKYSGFLRNVAVALGNSRDVGAIEFWPMLWNTLSPWFARTLPGHWDKSAAKNPNAPSRQPLSGKPIRASARKSKQPQRFVKHLKPRKRNKPSI